MLGLAASFPLSFTDYSKSMCEMLCTTRHPCIPPHKHTYPVYEHSHTRTYTHTHTRTYTRTHAHALFLPSSQQTIRLQQHCRQTLWLSVIHQCCFGTCVWCVPLSSFSSLTLSRSLLFLSFSLRCPSPPLLTSPLLPCSRSLSL